MASKMLGHKPDTLGQSRPFIRISCSVLNGAAERTDCEKVYLQNSYPKCITAYIFSTPERVYSALALLAL